jgi:hypothetical protein
MRILRRKSELVADEQHEHREHLMRLQGVPALIKLRVGSPGAEPMPSMADTLVKCGVVGCLKLPEASYVRRLEPC